MIGHLAGTLDVAVFSAEVVERGCPFVLAVVVPDAGVDEAVADERTGIVVRADDRPGALPPPPHAAVEQPSPTTTVAAPTQLQSPFIMPSMGEEAILTPRRPLVDIA